MKFLISTLCVLLLTTACSNKSTNNYSSKYSQPQSSQATYNTLPPIVNSARSSDTTAAYQHKAEEGTVIIYKYDNSKQCGSNGHSEHSMASDLENIGIGVICKEKAADGKIYTANCGSPTGMMNVFKISSAYLSKAKNNGYRPVTEIAEYNGYACLY